ncbi:MAG: lamin tail domain-containing protein, partial [Bacteroidetes bacterium]|nr:lamin tail domain-containing protein [Bacteroidota bacterium]
MSAFTLRAVAVFFGLFSSGLVFSQAIFINEFLASNSNGLTDEHGQPDDWMELFNAGATPIDIGGMYVTDDLAQPVKWQIPATDPAASTIPPGGFLLLWLDGETAQGVLHVAP